MSVEMIVVPAIKTAEIDELNCILSTTALQFQSRAYHIQELSSRLENTKYYLPESLDEYQEREDAYGNPMKQTTAENLIELLEQCKMNQNFGDKANIAYLKALPKETICVLFFE